jgi:hypothetical protein
VKANANILTQLKNYLLVSGLSLFIIFGFVMEGSNASFFSEVEQEQKVEEEKLGENFGASLNFNTGSEKGAGSDGKNKQPVSIAKQQSTAPYYTNPFLPFSAEINLQPTPQIIGNTQNLPCYLLLHSLIFYDYSHIS